MTSCQKCRHPIRFDDSLNSVGSTSLNMVKSSLNTLNNVQIPDITHKHSGTITPNTRKVIKKPTNNLNDSYIDVKEDSAGAAEDTESPSMIRMKLFALLSTKSDIKHPLCVDCANVALDLLTNEFDDLKRERDAYISFDSVSTSLKDQFEPKMDEKEAERLIEKVGCGLCSNSLLTPQAAREGDSRENIAAG